VALTSTRPADGSVAGPGLIRFDLADDQVRVAPVGHLYFYQAKGVTARVHLKAFDVDGSLAQRGLCCAHRQDGQGRLMRQPVPPWPDADPCLTTSYASATDARICRADRSLDVALGTDAYGNPTDWTQFGNTVTAYIQAISGSDHADQTAPAHAVPSPATRPQPSPIRPCHLRPAVATIRRNATLRATGLSRAPRSRRTVRERNPDEHDGVRRGQPAWPSASIGEGLGAKSTTGAYPRDGALREFELL